MTQTQNLKTMIYKTTITPISCDRGHLTLSIKKAPRFLGFLFSGSERTFRLEKGKYGGEHGFWFTPLNEYDKHGDNYGVKRDQGYGYLVRYSVSQYKFCHLTNDMCKDLWDECVRNVYKQEPEGNWEF